MRANGATSSRVLHLFLVLLLASCTNPPKLTSNHPFDRHRASPWANALRALDPVDVNTPANDITAIYLRQQEELLQIRIDLLGFKKQSELSLDVRIEDGSAPQASPLIIHIPSQTESARITLAPQLATVIIDIPDHPPHPSVDISTPEEQINDLTLDSPVITQTAPLLLAFYNLFAARLPAEVLRSWDGAHTGPRGERHGLKHLLDAVEEYQVPVALLDLKEPENLSALDAMGVMPQISALENQGLLILPEGTESDFQFVHIEDPTHVYQPFLSKTMYIPIPTETITSQPTPDGPALEIRRVLLETALNTNEKDLLILGGSFPNTTWGSPDMIEPTLAYFASRPYIHILSLADLPAFPTTTGQPDILPQLESPLDDLTLQSQAALEYADSWAKSPPTTVITQCQSGLAFPDCLLANQTYLAIFDTQGAQLVYLFTAEQGALHQLIGPSYQVAPGINIYPGAFADDKEYQVSIHEDAFIFIATDGTRTKTFTLTETGLDVSYQTQEPVTVEIPLLVDPDTRFTPGWADRYVQETTPNRIRWGLENELMVDIQTQGVVSMRTFNEDLSLLQGPENPDYSYPPGHYVPFPIAVVDVEMQDGYFLRVERFP